MSDEEVRRVTDALDEVDRIENPEVRVRARNLIMAEQVRRNRAWSAERRELIIKLWDGGNGLSYRQIADRLGCKLSTVQDVFRGYTGSGKHRPKASEGEAGEG
jgi:DNA-directed RNA polymerase specialized sigma24 family protein